MSTLRRVLAVIGVSAMLGSCAAPATQSPGLSASTPAASSQPTAAAATASVPLATASAATTASPAPSSSAEPTEEPTPAPTVNPSFAPQSPPQSIVTPAVPAAAATWRSIGWTKYPASSPASHLRAAVRWQGGFVATGDLWWRSETSASTRVWTSTDGRAWQPLPADALGPNAYVASVAPVGDGLVALVFRVKSVRDGERDPADRDTWEVTGPWESWASSDGRTWTGHPGPAFEHPSSMRADLVRGAGVPTVALVAEGQPVAFTTDGVTWRTASLNAFPGGPAGWHPEGTAALSPGFVSVSSSGHAASSVDGAAWTSHELSDACPANGLVAGSSGVILTGSLEADIHDWSETWCTSADGAGWTPNLTLAPLGRVGDQRGDRYEASANGLLLGDGERIVAYRGYKEQAGWASFDGLHWTALRFANGPPTGWVDPWGWETGSGNGGTVTLTPIGLLALDRTTGVLWLGSPSG